MVRLVILVVFTVFAVSVVAHGDLNEKLQEQNCVCDREIGVIESLISFHNAAIGTIDVFFSFSTAALGLGISWTEVKEHGQGLYVRGTEMSCKVYESASEMVGTLGKSAMEVGDNIATEQLGKEQVNQLKSQGLDFWAKFQKLSDVAFAHVDVVKTHGNHYGGALLTKREVAPGFVLEQGILDLIAVAVYLFVLVLLLYLVVVIALKCSCLVLWPIKLLLCIFSCGFCCSSGNNTSLPPSSKRAPAKNVKKNGLSSPPPASMSNKKSHKK